MVCINDNKVFASLNLKQHARVFLVQFYCDIIITGAQKHTAGRHLFSTILMTASKELCNSFFYK